jgi:predicted flavoprotein YhiN
LPLIGREIISRAGLDPRAAAAPAGLAVFGRMLRAFPLTVTGIGDASRCQVHRGGIDVAAVDPASMQVAAPGRLFACGEALDVDAPCGGFNLHWAWTSGLIAGKAVAQR